MECQRPQLKAAQRRYTERYPERAREATRRWHAANRHDYIPKMKRRKRLEQYGLTEEQFAAMMASQGDACRICARTLEQPCVDHCHTTGRVRGLLCHTCNRAIGMLGDNPALLRVAANYVEDPYSMMPADVAAFFEVGS